MSITKEIEQEAAKIRGHLAFAILEGNSRVYAYWDGDDIVIKDKIYCNGGLQAMGTYDKWMDDDKILARLKHHIDCLITHGHIPSSLGRWSELMRNSDITE